MVPGYSDLDIEQYSLELDLAYELNADLVLGVGLAMNIYEDNDPYLFEDDGELYVLSAGLNYVF
jgi:hypothetical protein